MIILYIPAEGASGGLQSSLNQIKSIYNGASSRKVIITDRELALVRAVQEVLPSSNHLLCRWHVENNVLANSKVKFGTSKEFDDSMSDWSHGKILKLLPARGKISKSSMNQSQVYCCTWKRHGLCIRNDLQLHGQSFILPSGILTHLAATETRVYHYLNDRIYDGVVRKLSLFALKKIKDEIKEGLAGNRAATYTHAFEAIYGLPCWHSLSKKIDNDQTLLPSIIHQQWHLSPEITSTVSEDAEKDSETGIVEFRKLCSNLRQLSKA
ncbi:unnamed protein product [Albugo candida]|uniref:MULE transposase domain-containing protein n=1 Tax=Albugo candida TaxID=65357 RepID=A0A024GL18_9STRA|nr:unnamed protein product [Albugo candida]|eukprot:CCI47587.1 unnamed protein product [Albugo candida]